MDDKWEIEEAIMLILRESKDEWLTTTAVYRTMKDRYGCDFNKDRIRDRLDSLVLHYAELESKTERIQGHKTNFYRMVAECR